MTATFTTPIIMSTPMVVALLDGRKGQTRRLPTNQWRNLKKRFDQGERCFVWVRETWADVNTENGPALMFKNGSLRFCVDDAYPVEYERYPGMQFTMWCGDLARGEPGHSWRPSIHMPRWASRLTLEVTDVRLQKLQDISEADAQAEGDPDQGLIASENTHRDWYRCLWESLHGEGTWDTNPDIVAISFSVYRQNIDALLADRGLA